MAAACCAHSDLVCEANRYETSIALARECHCFFARAWACHASRVLRGRAKRLFWDECRDVDYLEMPSQMFENWAYQPEAVQRMSCHYKTGESLPLEMMDALLSSSKANAAIKNFGAMWWVARSAIDQAMHLEPPIDVALAAKEIWNDFMGIKASPGTNMGPVRHMADPGYGGLWYSYLWSQVYSADAFSRFEKEGIFNPATGAAYRKEILAPGGSRDGMDSLVAYLDRQPSVDAFLKAKGLTTDTSDECSVKKLNTDCQVEAHTPKQVVPLREVN